MSDVLSRTTFSSVPARAWWGILGVVAFVAAGAFIAYWKVFTNFQPYDDEGYILLSLREFLRMGGLYTHVYSQYGPFPYELWGAVYKVFGGQVTPDNARAIVIVVWLLSSLLVGVTVERVTHSLITGLIATITAFACLAVIGNEILIPDDLTAFLAIVLLAASALAASHPRLQLSLIGVCVGAMLMTKINIGGAVLLASCLAIAASSPALAARPAIAWGFAGLGVVMPLVVMNPDLSSAWAENLAVLIALGAVGVGAVANRAMRGPRAANEAGVDYVWFVVAAIVTVIVLVVIIVALGTSPGDLIHGVVIGPLGQRNAFSEAAPIPTVAFDLAVVGVVCALVARREVSRSVGPLPAGVVRVVVGVLILLWSTGALPFTPNPDPTTLGVALPFAWLAAAPPAVADEPRQRLTRLLIAAVPVYAAIGIYPVAGSQLYYAAVLCLPAGAVIMADGVKQLRRWVAERAPGNGVHLLASSRLIGLGLLAVFSYQLLLQSGISSANAYADNTPLHIAGATRIRLSAATADAYSQLTYILQTRCDQFLTLPGLNSFYLWASQIPPTGDNVTSWMFLLNRGQQQRIVDAVQRTPRLCLVENATELSSWEEGRTPPARPLYQFVTSPDFKQIYSAGGYTIARRTK